MKDRQQDIARTGQWAFDKLAERMQQPPESISDKANGDGFAFNLVQDGEARFLDIFPQARAVEITTPDVQIRFRNALPARPAQDGILIESADGKSRALFLRDGHVAVEVFPFQTGTPLESPTGIPDEQDGVRRDSAPNAVGDGASGEIRASGEPVASEQSEKDKNRVRFTGRLGADPHFREGKSGLIANFPVAEHVEEQEQPTWHKVYTTGDRAKRLQEKPISKGQEVRVDGYRQQRERKGRDGKTETVEVVYAAHVRPYKNADSAAAPAVARPEDTESVPV